MPVAYHEHVPLTTPLRLADDRLVVFLANVMNQSIQPLVDLLRTLAVGAPVTPDIPRAKTLRLPERADLGAGDALIGAVVPFGDGGSDLDACVGPLFFCGRGVVGSLPGVWGATA